AQGINPDGSNGPAGETDVTVSSNAACAASASSPAGNPFVANSGFDPVLGCIDLTRPTVSCTGTRGLFQFSGRGDIKEVGLFLQDTITKGSWSFNIGIRGDLYRGISNRTNQAEPRAGIAYNIKRTNTVLRVSYARVLETPFNENLILAST